MLQIHKVGAVVCGTHSLDIFQHERRLGFLLTQLLRALGVGKLNPKHVLQVELAKPGNSFVLVHELQAHFGLYHHAVITLLQTAMSSSNAKFQQTSRLLAQALHPVFMTRLKCDLLAGKCSPILA